MSPVYKRLGVKREALAKVLQAEVDRRGGAHEYIGYGDGNGFYAAGIAEEIEAAGKMTAGTAKRRLHAIMNGGWYTTPSGKRIQQQVVNFDTADTILTALHMNELWHTNAELAAAVVEPPKKKPEPLKVREAKPCRGCGGDWNVFRTDCRTCVSRRYNRVKRERDQRAALVQSLDGPRHGSTRTGRVSAGGGTQSYKEAA